MNNLFEWTLTALNTSAFMYLAACFAYIIAISRSREDKIRKWVGWATWIVYISFALHTFGLGGRWVLGGLERPPWTNLYESLVAFAWGVVLFQIYVSRKWKFPTIGVIASPLVFILMGMSVMTPNKSLEPLIPALQSYWLKIHVIFGVLSYAGFTIAGCIAFFYLMRRGVSLSKIAAGICFVMLFNLSIAGGREAFSSGRFFMARTTTKTLPDGQSVQTKDTYRDYEGGPVITRMEEVPYAYIPFWLSWGLFLAATIGFWTRRRRENDALPDEGEELSPEAAVKKGHDVTKFAGHLYHAAMIAFVALCANVMWAKNLSPTLSMASNPYLVMLLLMSFFLGLVYLVAQWRYLPFLKSLPSAGRLDELGYKNILFALPFQTLLLVTGAVWAYSAWGRSWGWDPKEIGALITWFAYLIYLHGRLLMRWNGVLLAIVSIVGFMILIFAFLGVNLVLSGLHSYGAA